MRCRACRDCERALNDGIRYVLYRSYVLLSATPIEPISEHIPDQFPLGKAQRLGGRAYESPALPLSYSAVVFKLTERIPERQTTALRRIANGA